MTFCSSLPPEEWRNQDGWRWKTWIKLLRTLKSATAWQFVTTRSYCMTMMMVVDGDTDANQPVKRKSIPKGVKLIIMIRSVPNTLEILWWFTYQPNKPQYTSERKLLLERTSTRTWQTSLSLYFYQKKFDHLLSHQQGDDSKGYSRPSVLETSTYNLNHNSNDLFAKAYRSRADHPRMYTFMLSLGAQKFLTSVSIPTMMPIELWT